MDNSFASKFTGEKEHVSFHIYRIGNETRWFGEAIWRHGRNRGKCGPIGPFDTYGEAMEAAREIYEFDMKGWEIKNDPDSGTVPT